MPRSPITYRGVQLADLPQLRRFDEDTRHAIRVVASVLPFKVNEYVLDELIDWSAAPEDPIYRLTFPAREMLPDDVFDTISGLLRNDASVTEVKAAAAKLRYRLNPHPSGQLLNLPVLDDALLSGLQHKYEQTLLVFPAQGQTCHAYCGYCFRWAQFVGGDFRFSGSQAASMVAYLHQHPEVSDVLLTGGDPLIMSSAVLRRWVEALLAPELEHVSTIRIGTKALAYWPRRVLDEPDGPELLALIEQAVAAGKHVAVMMHVSHPRELRTEPARRAIAALRSAGATLRAQAPIIARVNDSARVWADMWREMVALGIAPYYTFIERDTGAHAYFEVPIARALEIYSGAQRMVSGLARTARGPVMSATAGKIVVDGEAVIAGRRVFVLRMLQARDPALVGRVFFARFSAEASWIDDLRPAFADTWPWDSHLTEPPAPTGELIRTQQTTR